MDRSVTITDMVVVSTTTPNTFAPAARVISSLAAATSIIDRDSIMGDERHHLKRGIDAAFRTGGTESQRQETAFFSLSGRPPLVQNLPGSLPPSSDSFGDEASISNMHCDDYYEQD